MSKESSYNVLHICNYNAPYRGNFISSLESLEKYQKNVKCFYLFPSGAESSAAREWIDDMNKNGTVAYIQKSGFFKNLIFLSEILKKHKINRIVRHFSDHRIDIATKLLFGGKRVIRFFHSGYPIKSARSVKHLMAKFIWRGNTLVGVSDSVTEQLRQAFPSFKSHSVVNAISFESLDGPSVQKQGKAVSLLMMGWQPDIKGVDLAIRAAGALVDKYPLTLSIVSGPSSNIIKDMEVSLLGKEADWIRLLPMSNRVGDYYRASDIFLSPSRSEAFGYSNVEAAYCENSIVFSEVGGQAELMIDGAYRVRPDDPDDLKEKLEAAILELNTPEKRAERKNTKAAVEQIYSLEAWSSRLTELF